MLLSNAWGDPEVSPLFYSQQILLKLTGKDPVTLWGHAVAKMTKRNPVLHNTAAGQTQSCWAVSFSKRSSRISVVLIKSAQKNQSINGPDRKNPNITEINDFKLSSTFYHVNVSQLSCVIIDTPSSYLVNHTSRYIGSLTGLHSSIQKPLRK